MPAFADLTPLPLDDLAPPDAVRFTAAPLFVPVEDFEPPDRPAVAERAAEDLEAAFFAVPADFEAPVLPVDELFAVELFLEPPVEAVPDLLPPWLERDDDFVPDADFFAALFNLVELFAVAIL